MGLFTIGIVVGLVIGLVAGYFMWGWKPLGPEPPMGSGVA